MSKIKTFLLKYKNQKPLFFLGAVSLVSIAYLLNMALGLLRDASLAAGFGASQELDSLLIAFNFLRAMGIQIGLASSIVLIPIMVRWDRSSKEPLRLAMRWAKILLLMSLILALLIWFFPDIVAKLLGPGLNDYGFSILKNSLVDLAVLLILLPLAGLFKAMLDSSGAFLGYPIFLGLMTTGTALGALLNPGDISGVIRGILLGSGAGLLIQVLMFIRTRTNINRSPSNESESQATTTTVKLPLGNFVIVLASFIVILLQGTIERAFVSGLPTGSLTAMSLALSVVAVPSNLILPAFTSVFLPELSRTADQRTDGQLGLPRTIYIGLIVIMAAAITILWFGSVPLISILFGHGKFTDEAVFETAKLVRLFSLSTIGYVLNSVFRQELFARKKVKLDLGISVLILFIKIGLLMWLVPKLGILAIAVEANIVSYFSAMIYFVMAKQRKIASFRKIYEQD